MKQIILTDKAPMPIGAYSQAVKHNGQLFISGQLAIDPATNKLVFGGIEKEATLVMENIGNILSAAGMTYENVLYATILLRDINDFEKVNAVYSQYFKKETAPARVAYQIACLPKNANIEITMVAGE
ncbi:MAG: Rid family detoxifying hydrolase [Flavobacteriales bacterium]|nr:Rid family detoxifying hydrolase [Flavobacteriales bacterium]